MIKNIYLKKQSLYLIKFWKCCNRIGGVGGEYLLFSLLFNLILEFLAQEKIINKNEYILKGRR